MPSSKNLSMPLINKENSYDTGEAWIIGINITVLHRFCLHKYHLIQLEFLPSSTVRILLLLTIDLKEITYKRTVFRGFNVFNGRNKNSIFLTLLFFIRLCECTFLLTSHLLDNKKVHSIYTRSLHDRKKREYQ